MIASDTTLIDLNEIPAPWPRLSMFENSTNRLKKKLADVMSAEERLENYNDLQIDKVNSKSMIMKRTKKLKKKILKFPDEYKIIKCECKMAKTSNKSTQKKQRFGIFENEFNEFLN